MQYKTCMLFLLLIIITPIRGDGLHCAAFPGMGPALTPSGLQAPGTPESFPEAFMGRDFPGGQWEAGRPVRKEGPGLPGGSPVPTKPSARFREAFPESPASIFPAYIPHMLCLASLLTGVFFFFFRTPRQKKLTGLVQRQGIRSREIESLKKSQENFHNIVERLEEGILVAGGDGTVMFLNSAAESLLGGRPESLSSLPLGPLLHAGGAYEIEAPGQEGGNRTLKISSLETQWDGAPATLFSLCDITRRKHRDQERVHLESMLRQAQKMEAIGTLAGGIAHDFNNILSAIIGHAEILEMFAVEAGSEIADSLDQILKAAYRAQDLVRQILSFSRSGDQVQRPVLLQAVIKEVLKLMRASLPSTIRIRQTLKNPECRVIADPTQIHQIMMNLCTNAAHAMESRGGELEISLERVEVNQGAPCPGRLPWGAYALITVRDTGAGIPPEVMERLFEPYFTTRPKGEGTGLGLAVVHGIVEGHGGAIRVDSWPGKGSSFFVYLPLSAGPDSGGQEEPMGGPAPTGRGRVLFVDDEESLVMFSKKMLELLGYEADARLDSRQALAAFEADPHGFDLVITDQTMPFMTGLDLAKRIHSVRPEIPIVLCTGFSEAVSPEALAAAGIRELVLKPLRAKQFAELISSILQDERKCQACK